MGKTTHTGTRRHLPPVLAISVFAVALLTVMWAHAAAADGVTRSFRFSGKAIALTIDDGPHPVHTPAVLDVLREQGAHATFFVVAETAAAHPELIARMVEEGHEVAFHTNTHPHVDRLSDQAVGREFRDGLKTLRSLSVKPSWYRPPRGRLTPVQSALSTEHGMKVALWTRCMERSCFTTAQEMASTLAAETRHGDVVLAHDGIIDRSMTVAALPVYLRALRAKGVDVVTLSELARRTPTLVSAPRSRSATERVSGL